LSLKFVLRLEVSCFLVLAQDLSESLGKLLAPEAPEVKAIVPAHSGSVDSLKPLVDSGRHLIHI
jgi:hypothetical protein